MSALSRGRYTCADYLLNLIEIDVSLKDVNGASILTTVTHGECSDDVRRHLILKILSRSPDFSEKDFTIINLNANLYDHAFDVKKIEEMQRRSQSRHAFMLSCLERIKE